VTLKYDSERTRELYRCIALEFEAQFQYLIAEIIESGGRIGHARHVQWRVNHQEKQKVLCTEHDWLSDNTEPFRGTSVERINRETNWDSAAIWMPVTEGELVL